MAHIALTQYVSSVLFYLTTQDRCIAMVVAQAERRYSWKAKKEQCRTCKYGSRAYPRGGFFSVLGIFMEDTKGKPCIVHM